MLVEFPIMRYLLSLAVTTTALWLGISGVYKPVILLLGAGSVLMVVWLSARMEVVGTEHNPVIYSWRLPVYWVWLIGQIFSANLNVARSVLSPERIDPQIIRVPVNHKSAVARVTYANSVTLTPGTVSLYLSDQELLVHALDRKSAEGVEQGEMERRVQWLEGRRTAGRSK